MLHSVPWNMALSTSQAIYTKTCKHEIKISMQFDRIFVFFQPLQNFTFFK